MPKIRKLTANQRRELSKWLRGKGYWPSQAGQLLAGEKGWKTWELYQQEKRNNAGLNEMGLTPELQAKADEIQRRMIEEEKGKAASVQVRDKPKGRGPGKAPRKITTSVQLDQSLIDGLTRLAEKEERTVSALIRLAIRDYLERKGA